MEAITVYIDNDVWNLLFKLGLDLAVALPKDEYNIRITREAEFEIESIPDIGKDGSDKKPLKKFINDTIEESGIKTHTYFGFYDDRHSSNEQRGHGLITYDNYNESVGGCITYKEAPLLIQLDKKLGKQKKPSTKLYGNEADISIAVRSCAAVVLTLNNKKKQPLYAAHQQGGKVIFLNEFEDSRMSLKDFIKCQSRSIT